MSSKSLQINRGESFKQITITRASSKNIWSCKGYIFRALENHQAQQY